MTLYYWPTSYNTSLYGQTIPTGPVNITGFLSVYPGSPNSPEFIPISYSSATTPTTTLVFNGAANYNWTTGDANWQVNASSKPLWVDDGTENALFNATDTGGTTVTISGTRTVNSLIFSGTKSYTISGGAIHIAAGITTANSVAAPAATTVTINSNVVLSAAQAWAVDTSQTLAVNGTITGAGGQTLTKSGPGTLAIDGTATLPAGLVVNQGTLTGTGTVTGATTLYGATLLAPANGTLTLGALLLGGVQSNLLVNTPGTDKITLTGA